MKIWACFSVLSLWTLPVNNSVIQVEIGVPGFEAPTSNSALSYIGPGFEEAVVDCNRLYNATLNFSMSFLTVRGMQAREPYAITDLMTGSIAEWYYTMRRDPNGVAAIITGGGQDSSLFHQLTANWNALYITSVAYSISTYTLSGPPPLVTAVVSVETLAVTVLNLVQFYNWTTIFAVVDYDSPPVYYSVADVMAVKRPKLRQPVLQYTRSIRSKQLGSFADLLQEFQTVSRVLIFLGRSELLRRLMIEAASQNLTNGEFVFICVEPHRYFKQYGNYTWQYGDAYDEIARDAFRSLLIIHPLDDEVIQSVGQQKLAAQFGARARARIKQLYNVTYPARDHNVWDLLATYSSVKMYCQIINQSLHTNGVDFLKNGRQLVHNFLNTSFRDDYSDIFIDPIGIRRTTHVVSQMVHCSQERQSFLIQPQESNFRLRLILNVSMEDCWPGTNASWPPLNEPFCGYQQEKVRCQVTEDITRQPIFVAMITLASLLVTFPAVILVLRRYLLGQQMNDHWWKLDPEVLNLRPRRSTLQFPLSKTKYDSTMQVHHHNRLHPNFADFDWSRRTSAFSEEPARQLH